MKFVHYLLAILLFVVFLIYVPIFTNHIVNTGSIFGNKIQGSVDSWLGFYGGFIGAMSGTIISVIISLTVVSQQRRERNKERKYDERIKLLYNFSEINRKLENATLDMYCSIADTRCKNLAQFIESLSSLSIKESMKDFRGITSALSELENFLILGRILFPRINIYQEYYDEFMMVNDQYTKFVRDILYTTDDSTKDKTEYAKNMIQEIADKIMDFVKYTSKTISNLQGEIYYKIKIRPNRSTSC